MAEPATEGIGEQDGVRPLRVPPRRPAERTGQRTSDRTGQRTSDRTAPEPAARSARRAGFSAVAARFGRLTWTGPVAGSYVTVRGVALAMFGIFLFCSLVASWLNFGALTGLGYVASCVLAPFLVRRHAQLHVVIAPPAIFMAVVILTQVLTAQGTSRHGRVLSVLEGTVLTLAAIAPWLFAGTVLGAVASATRGLRQCVREVVAEFRGEAETDFGDQAAGASEAAAVRKF
jgi:hypothetical protein